MTLQDKTNLKEYTAADCLSGVCTHDQYWRQFVNDNIKSYVASRIGMAAIERSKDEHFNDIPLRNWDDLHAIRGMVDGAKWRRLHNTTYPEKNKNDFLWSLSCQVCIAKQAARLLKQD